MHFGTLVGRFLDHFGVMLSSEIVLEAPWELCLAWKSIFWVRPRPFWRVLERFWASFWRYFGIFCRYRLHYEILYDLKTIFDGFWYLVDKQNQAKSMEDSAKINFASSLLSSEYGHWFWTEFGVWLGAISSSIRPSEATSNASVIKHENEKESESINDPPPRIFSEKDTGRASHADITPYGVGGWREALRAGRSCT